MPIINPDTSEMEDLTPLDDGTYPAEIADCGAQNSKEKGTPMIVPTFKVQASGDKPRTRKAYHPVSGPGSFLFDQLLRACRMEEIADAIQANPGKVPFDTDTLKGHRVNVVVTGELYNNQRRDRISGYLPA